MNSVSRLVPARPRWLCALFMSAAVSLTPAASSRLGAAALPSGATLTVLAQPVEVAPGGGQAFVAAAPGQLLGPGALVRTGSQGVALLTFFDGSESQVGGDSQVQIEQADYAKGPQIALFQSAGVTVNRVIPLPPGGSFRTDTPDATGLVRGTSYVVTVSSPSAAGADDTSTDATSPGAPAPTAVAATTSVVLLTDLDGHVGRVHVVPTHAAPEAADASRVELTRAGDVGAVARQAPVSGVAGHTATAMHLDNGALGRLEHAAHNMHDASSSREAVEQARQVARLTTPVVSPHAAPETGKPEAKPATSGQASPERPERASATSAAKRPAVEAERLAESGARVAVNAGEAESDAGRQSAASRAATLRAAAAGAAERQADSAAQAQASSPARGQATNSASSTDASDRSDRADDSRGAAASAATVSNSPAARAAAAPATVAPPPAASQPSTGVASPPVSTSTAPAAVATTSSPTQAVSVAATKASDASSSAKAKPDVTDSQTKP